MGQPRWCGRLDKLTLASKSTRLVSEVVAQQAHEALSGSWYTPRLKSHEQGQTRPAIPIHTARPYILVHLNDRRPPLVYTAQHPLRCMHRVFRLIHHVHTTFSRARIHVPGPLLRARLRWWFVFLKNKNSSDNCFRIMTPMATEDWAAPTLSA